MLTVKQHVKIIREYLKLKDTDNARIQLERLRAIAKTPTERTIAHDIGNDIQRVMFEVYEVSA